MLDVAVAYDRYKFLGYEFLTWRWFMMESDFEGLYNLQKELSSIEMGNRLVLENRHTGTIEVVTIKGDEAGLEEAQLALRKGAMVSEINISFKISDQQWRYTIKGESLNISTMKVPETGPIESAEDFEGGILEKIYMYEKGILLLENIYKKFIHLRVSNEWKKQVVPNIRKWMAA
jgi:hypothetical protein